MLRLLVIVVQWVSIPAGATETITSSLWTGPKLQNKMAEVANHLDLTVDYGWAWFIAKTIILVINFLFKVSYLTGVWQLFVSP